MRRSALDETARAKLTELLTLEANQHNAFHARAVSWLGALGAARDPDAAALVTRADDAVKRHAWGEVRVYRTALVSLGSPNALLDLQIAGAVGPSLEQAAGRTPTTSQGFVVEETTLDLLDAVALAKDVGIQSPDGVDLDALAAALENGTPPPAPR